MIYLNLRLDAFSVTEHFSPFPAFYRRPTTNLVLFTMHEISKKVDSFFNINPKREIDKCTAGPSVTVPLDKARALAKEQSLTCDIARLLSCPEIRS